MFHQLSNCCTHGFANHSCLPSSSMSDRTDCTNETVSSVKNRTSSTPGKITSSVITTITLIAASVARPRNRWSSQA